MTEDRGAVAVIGVARRQYYSRIKFFLKSRCKFLTFKNNLVWASRFLNWGDPSDTYIHVVGTCPGRWKMFSRGMNDTLEEFS